MSRILTIDEASEMLHLSPNVARDYLRRGKLPGSKTGRYWRIVEEDLVPFVRGTGPYAQEEARVREGKARQWKSLSREEKLKRIDAVMGKYADVPFSSEDLIRERREDAER